MMKNLFKIIILFTSLNYCCSNVDNYPSISSDIESYISFRNLLNKNDTLKIFDLFKEIQLFEEKTSLSLIKAIELEYCLHKDQKCNLELNVNNLEKPYSTLAYARYLVKQMKLKKADELLIELLNKNKNTLIFKEANLIRNEISIRNLDSNLTITENNRLNLYQEDDFYTSSILLYESRVLIRNGQYNHAISKSYDALAALSKEVYPELKSELYTNLGVAFLNKDEVKLATKYFLKSISLIKQQNLKASKLARAKVNFAIIQSINNQSNDVLEIVKEVTSFEFFDPLWNVYLNYQCAFLCQSLDCPLTSEEYFIEAYSFVDSTSCDPFAQRLNRLNANFLIASQKLENALLFLNMNKDCQKESVAVTKFFLDNQAYADIYFQLCATDSEIQNCTKALKYLKMQDNASINIMKNDENHYSHYMYLNQRRRIRIQNLLAGMTGNKKNISEAFKNLITTKYRSTKNRQGFNKSEIDEINKIASQKEQEKLIYWIENGTDIDANNKLWRRQLQSLFNSDKPPLITKNKEKEGTSVYDLHKIQNWLDTNNAQAIEFLEDEGNYWAFYLNKDTMYFNLVESKNTNLDLTQISNQLRSYEPSEDSLMQLNNSLLEMHDLFVTPFIDTSISNLIIIPDQELNQIPFEALRSGNSYLIEDYNISYTYGIDELPRYTGAADVIEDVSFMSHSDQESFNSLEEQVYPEIIGSLVEIESCSQTLPCGSDLYSGQEASIKNLKRSLSSDFCHLALHAFSNPEERLENYIVIRDKDTVEHVHGYQFSDFDIRLRQAVLSACQTGEGKYLPGEGVFSISRYLIEQGVPSTIKSLWLLDDKSSAAITPIYYRYIQQGYKSNYALSQAKREYLNNHNPHPYYWASLVLEGNPIQRFEFCK